MLFPNLLWDRHLKDRHLKDIYVVDSVVSSRDPCNIIPFNGMPTKSRFISQEEADYHDIPPCPNIIFPRSSASSFLHLMIRAQLRRALSTQSGSSLAGERSCLAINCSPCPAHPPVQYVVNDHEYCIQINFTSDEGFPSLFLKYSILFRFLQRLAMFEMLLFY